MDTFNLLHDGVRQVLAHRLGWNDLRSVQEEAYHAVIAGNDVLVIAPTAGGKTEAALIPVVDGILKGGLSGVAALYLAPLKALINDQEERFSAFCLPNGLEVLKWHGDVPKGDRVWKDGEPPHILMITPESLEVLLMERDLSLGLSNLRYLIIDGACIRRVRPGGADEGAARSPGQGFRAKGPADRPFCHGRQP